VKWIKKGHIFKPNGRFSWSQSHAQIPRAIVLKDRIRIYYATRYIDKLGLPLSQTSFIDVDKIDLAKVLYVHNKTILNLGIPGSFYEHGIHPVMPIVKDEKTYLIYQGWRRISKYPYVTEMGLAYSADEGKSFKNLSDFPFWGLSKIDPLFVNGLFLYNNHCWYSSGVKWIKYNGRYESVYKIKQATTRDDYTPQSTNNFCIEEVTEDECQNSATVLKINNKYHMWFCYRKALDFRNIANGYRIGHAISDDMTVWKRDNNYNGLPVSTNNGWDSEMVCYPYVFRVNDKIIMLYSGNYFGRDGFGYAELEL